ncbi:MAG: MbcA/ParS/Xre antitoxin family protein [Gammaproteobacteria bacterium]|nr:MbcA/ParS/Xre antitoxin family protein [Gammaproteobacteria bacterium]
MATHITPEEQQALAKMLLKLLDDWKLSSEQQISLLGMPDSTRIRALARHRAGEPLPDDGQLLARTQHLLAIERALHTSFPTNVALANFWITTENQYFGGRTPLEIMLEEGMDGIERVRAHLEHTDGW